MYPEFERIAADTRDVLNREYRWKTVRKGIWDIESPIFDRLAAYRFARTF